MTNKPLIIIPARGGSKGIPRKNVRLLSGRPLIAYSIDAALSVAPPQRIILSTDDEAIAQTARECGLEVPYMRPAELATDTAGSREVMLDAMAWADARGIEYTCIVLLQPTSPLRTVSDIKGAMALLRPGTDMVVSVTEAAANPYYDCMELTPEGTLHVSKGDGRYTRRQDAPKAYQFNGAVYVINPDSLRAMQMADFAKRIPYVMPAERSVDIDTTLDWVIAETLMRESEA